MIQKLYEGLDTKAIVEELKFSEWWDKVDFRTTFKNSPHAQVNDIVLRFTEIQEYDHIYDSFMCINYDAWYDHPMTVGATLDIMRLVQGVMLGRVVVTRLKPGGEVTPHIDHGISSEIYERYQFQLAGECDYTVGEETVRMKAGELWVFDNLMTHSVKQVGDEDRVTLIVDVLS